MLLARVVTDSYIPYVHHYKLQFSAIYVEERLILQTIYVLNKEFLQFLAYNLRFIIMSGFKSRVDYDGACTVLINLGQKLP